MTGESFHQNQLSQENTLEKSAPIVLCTLNSRYSHTGLAVRLLAAYLRKHWPSAPAVHLVEMTIHEPPLRMLRRLTEINASVVAFSCYIWNGRLIDTLSRDIKKIAPETIIIWGGPEAATRADDILKENESVDFIIRGEGEAAFLNLIQAIYANFSKKQTKASQKPEIIPPSVLAAIHGLCWRETNNCIRQNLPLNLTDGDDWVFPYDEKTLREDKNKILYYESTRGCPFHCRYCLSANDNQLRNRSVAKTCREIDFFLDHQVRQVKFVDRTFNANVERACAIWSHLIKRSKEKNSQTNFHFEIAADLLSDQAIDLLATAPPGLIQLEIGVQTTQPDVLAAIQRPCHLDRLKKNVALLLANGNIHLHLDLIAGLPGESFKQFADSFNDVFAMRPHQLQLGFLKVLPGTPMVKTAQERGFSWQHDAPYEILRSDALSFTELCRLKDISDLIEGYWHQTDMVPVIRFMISRTSSPFAFFNQLADWFNERGGFDRALSPADRAFFLWQFSSETDDQLKPDTLYGQAFRDLIRYLYISGGQKDQPGWLGYWEKQRADLKKDPELKVSNFIRHRLKKIEAARRDFHKKWPDIRRWRADHFSFAVQYFEQTGKLKPGDAVIYYDLAQPYPRPLEILEEEPLV